MRVWGDRYSRDLRRYSLAKRMFTHEARTQTIAAWTGLPKDRIRTLHSAQFAGSDEEPVTRHRGPSPNRVSYFFRSARLRNEAAALAGLCFQFGIVPRQSVRNPARELPDVARGERLCAAFEMYGLLMQESSVTLEHVVLLVLALAQSREIKVARCVGCGCAIVLDRYGQQRLACQYCASSMPGMPRRSVHDDASADSADAMVGQQSLL
jgi:hypothetical protein